MTIISRYNSRLLTSALDAQERLDAREGGGVHVPAICVFHTRLGPGTGAVEGGVGTATDDLRRALLHRPGVVMHHEDLVRGVHVISTGPEAGILGELLAVKDVQVVGISRGLYELKGGSAMRYHM